MKILVIGAGKEKSLGTLLRDSLSAHEFVLASRRANPSIGIIGCDICDASSVERVVNTTKPDCIIIGAGVYPSPVELGEICDWEAIQEHVRTKVLGCLIVLNAAAKYEVKHVIALAGSTIHADHRLLFYSLVNGGIYAAMYSMEIHKTMQCTYLELGPVPGSTMGDLYLSGLTEDVRAKTRLSTLDHLSSTIQEILSGKRDGLRFIQGCRIRI